jgi:hypothetical protein
MKDKELELDYRGKKNIIFWNGDRSAKIYVYDENLSKDLLVFENMDDIVENYYKKYYTKNTRLIYINHIKVWIYYLSEYFPEVKSFLQSESYQDKDTNLVIKIKFNNYKTKQIKEKFYSLSSLVVNAMEDTLNKSDLSYINKLSIVKDYILNITATYQGHTIASMARNERNLICNKYNTPETIEKYGHPLPFYDLRNSEDSEINANIREAYHGGMNYLNWNKVNRELNNIYHFDCNSFYPYIQSRFPLPKGEGMVKEINKKVCTLQEYMLLIEYKLIMNKKLGILDVIVELKSNKGYDNDVLKIFCSRYDNSKSGYLRKSERGFPCYRLFLTNLDVSLLFWLYDVKNLYLLKIREFETCKGRFNEFIYKYYTKKAELKEEINSKSTLEEKIPLIMEREKVKSILNFSTGGDGQKKYNYNNCYLPYIVFTTAYSRKLILFLINKIKDEFIYTNTDSIICTEAGKNILLNYINLSDRLGDWKLERIAKRFKILNHNTYIEEDENGKLYTCLGGLDKQLSTFITFENFQYNTEIGQEEITLYNNQNDNKINPFKIIAEVDSIFMSERKYKINIPQFTSIGF